MVSLVNCQDYDNATHVHGMLLGNSTDYVIRKVCDLCDPKGVTFVIRKGCVTFVTKKMCDFNKQCVTFVSKKVFASGRRTVCDFFQQIS